MITEYRESGSGAHLKKKGRMKNIMKSTTLMTKMSTLAHALKKWKAFIWYTICHRTGPARSDGSTKRNMKRSMMRKIINRNSKKKIMKTKNGHIMTTMVKESWKGTTAKKIN